VQETTRWKLDEVLRAVLELPGGTDVAGARQGNTAEWDSLAHVLLVGGIESEFGLEIDAADSLDLTSYDAIVLFLEGRGL